MTSSELTARRGASASRSSLLDRAEKRLGTLGRRFGLDAVELTALLVLAAFSVAVLCGLLLRGRPLAGADGLLASDQLQYFAWIREAANHILIGNPFDLAPGDRVFLHPGLLISGVIHKVVGLSIPLSFLLWKPIVVGTLFYGVLRYCRRLLPEGGQRHVGLILGLFAFAPATVIVAWSGWGGKPRRYMFDFIAGEMWSSGYLWGYLWTGIAVGLMPLVLLGIESWNEKRRPRTLGLAAGGALLVCWLQPWQGATLGLILVAVQGIRWRRTGQHPPLALLAVVVALVLPAAYYGVLSVYDPSWELAGENNARGAQTLWKWPWWAMFLVVAPLGLPALLAYRRPAETWQDIAVRVWPWAALLVFLLPFGTFPYHAFQGLTIPLAILAVQGVMATEWRPSPAVVVAIVGVFVLPGLAHRIDVARVSVHSGGDPYWVFPDEHRALDFLESDDRPGGVLAPTYASYLIPYLTGRESYHGQFSWAPDWDRRQFRSNALFEGRLRGAPALAFVGETNARFLFKDCRSGLKDLTALLRPVLQEIRRFGCATVWVLRERPEMARAAGKPDE